MRECRHSSTDWIGCRWRRYVDLTLCALVGTVICVAACRLIQVASSLFRRNLKDFPSLVQFAILAVCFATGLLVLKRLGACRFPDWRKLRNIRWRWWMMLFPPYPPVWTAGILGTILYYILVPPEWAMVSAQPTTESMWTMAAAGFVGYLLGWWLDASVLQAVLPIEPDTECRSATLEELVFPDRTTLLEWLVEEKPLTESKLDFIGSRMVAKQIAEQLAGPLLPSVGIVGADGSGKSTMSNWVRGILVNRNQSASESEDVILSCLVSGWGLRPGSAAEHVLQTMLETLALETDVSAIRGLPGDYQTALGNAHPVWGKVATSFLTAPTSPEQLLQGLDYILKVTKRRFVVFLEDLDRNQDAGPCREVDALLDRLKPLKKVSFVYAISNNHEGAHLVSRIADIIRMPPDVPPDVFVRLAKQFRDLLRQQHDVIDPVSEEDRDSRLGLYTSRIALPTGESFFASMDDRPIDAMYQLLTTPRLIKTAFRATYCAWERLHGEIDRDDLLIVNVLRVAAPEAFHFLMRHHRDLRAELSTDNEQNSRAEERRQRMLAVWADQTKNVSWDKDSGKLLVEFLFPLFEKKASRSQAVLQGVAAVPHMRSGDVYRVDYWLRAINEMAEGPLDQDVLRGIKETN